MQLIARLEANETHISEGDTIWLGASVILNDVNEFLLEASFNATEDPIFHEVDKLLSYILVLIWITHFSSIAIPQETGESVLLWLLCVFRSVRIHSVYERYSNFFRLAFLDKWNWMTQRRIGYLFWRKKPESLVFETANILLWEILQSTIPMACFSEVQRWSSYAVQN